MPSGPPRPRRKELSCSVPCGRAGRSVRSVPCAPADAARVTASASADNIDVLFMIMSSTNEQNESVIAGHAGVVRSRGDTSRGVARSARMHELHVGDLNGRERDMGGGTPHSRTHLW